MIGLSDESVMDVLPMNTLLALAPPRAPSILRQLSARVI